MSSAAARYDSIVVGGGHNGLVCAAYLARSGRSVLVLEASERVGGAAITREFAPGFSVSACAHLLHAALRSVLGDHVRQQGSHVAPDYLRFDFSHHEQPTREQLDEVFALANDAVLSDAVRRPRRVAGAPGDKSARRWLRPIALVFRPTDARPRPLRSRRRSRRRVAGRQG